MHACGHDGHSAVGIVLAEAIMENAAILCGRIISCSAGGRRGERGKSMSDSWKYPFPIICSPFIGFAEPDELVCGVDQFLVTTKFDVTFTGESAHAGTTPNKTRNALLAAAEATLQFQEIPPSPEGTIRVNIGCLTAGEARNAIAAKAFLQGETRGETEKLDAYVINEVQKLVPKCAPAIRRKQSFAVGRTASEPSDVWLCRLIARRQKTWAFIAELRSIHFPASEDATWLMRMVREQGGKASYLLFGTPMEAGHHSPDLISTRSTTAFTLLFRLACVGIRRERNWNIWMIEGRGGAAGIFPDSPFFGPLLVFDSGCVRGVH
ncbi:MAG: peptidase dimerization domain-containing protein [Eisenbergiella sp.]